jgi:hypothetical protein
MVYSIVDNFNKGTNRTYSLYPENSNAGVGTQFILYTPAVATKVKVRFYKVNGATPPTGTLVARLYGSHTNIFRDANDYADTLIAESTNSIAISSLTEGNNDAVEFTFNNVALPAGIYFICIYCGNLVNNDGYIRILGTDTPMSNVGYITFWYDAQGRWGNYAEW